MLGVLAAPFPSSMAPQHPSIHHSGTSDPPPNIASLHHPARENPSVNNRPSSSLPHTETDLLKSPLGFEGNFESDPCLEISVVFVGEEAMISTSLLPWGDIGQLQDLKRVIVCD